jgi:hypothetical protein
MRLLTILVLGTLLTSHANSPEGRLDTATIHQLYLEGDFDHAIDMLEAALKYDRVKTHEDSVFAYKHLGVMYTAKYETREVGKKYMYQLLMIEPTARIMDMYASDMIYMIFKNIQEEVEMSRGKPRYAAENLGKDTTHHGRTPVPKEKKRTWPYWAAGTAVAGVGLGFTAYFLLGQEPKPGTDYVVE